MEPDSAITVSTWMATADVPQFTPLTNHLNVDVCVVGAGIAGLSTAYLLARQGKSVVVLDDGPLAGGETQRTTAHLSNVIDDRYYEIERIHGKAASKLARDSHTAAIARIAQNIRDESIDCDFYYVDGYLFADEGQPKRKLEKEFRACQTAGFDDIELLANLPLAISDTSRLPCIRFPRQAQFHILKYLNGIAQALLHLNGAIYTATHVTDIEDGETVSVNTASGFIVNAKNVVIATNSPVTDWVKVHTKQSAYRTYVVAGRVPSASVPRALYWDMAEPYHYVRIQSVPDANYDLLIVGGEDHRTGQADVGTNQYQRLEAWAQEHFPTFGTVEHRWSGQIYETIDGLAFIGRDPGHGKNVYIATGDSGMGMTHGTIASILITDLINGKNNPWTSLYSPARKPVNAAFDYVLENVDTAIRYLDRFIPPQIKSAAEIELDSGAILEENGKKVAVYKSREGNVQRFCATCPHLSAIVSWNDMEKSWDCPAHGSRFKADGTVIDGPANRNLTPLPSEVDGTVQPVQPTIDSDIQAPGP